MPTEMRDGPISITLSDGTVIRSRYRVMSSDDWREVGGLRWNFGTVWIGQHEHYAINPDGSERPCTLMGEFFRVTQPPVRKPFWRRLIGIGAGT